MITRDGLWVGMQFQTSWGSLWEINKLENHKVYTYYIKEPDIFDSDDEEMFLECINKGSWTIMNKKPEQQYAVGQRVRVNSGSNVTVLLDKQPYKAVITEVDLEYHYQPCILVKCVDEEAWVYPQGDREPFDVEILTEETNNMKPNAYKVVKSFPGVKEGAIFEWVEGDQQYYWEDEDDSNNYFFYTYEQIQENKEWFKAVEELFKVGDWIVSDGAVYNNGSEYIGQVLRIQSDEIWLHNHNLNGGYSQHKNICTGTIEKLRKATQEEIETLTTCKMFVEHDEGILTFSISKSGIKCIDEDFDVSPTQLQAIVKLAEIKDRAGNWRMEFTHMTIGCKSGIVISDLESVLDKYKQLGGKV